MIDKAFKEFDKDITVLEPKRFELRKSRNSLRKKIRKYFIEVKQIKKPLFYGQGSYNMHTMIIPNGDEEYDIDDGVYLQEYDDYNLWDLPATISVHNWVKDAVQPHTNIPVKDKDTCVRVLFTSKDYHVDLPIYVRTNGNIYLAKKQSGWVISNPREFSQWFDNRVSIQGQFTRSMVRIFKYWRDIKNCDLKGITITVLVGELAYIDKNSKLNSLLGTLNRIINKLERNFTCIKPVIPNENLLQNYTVNKRNDVISKLKSLRTQLDNAVKSEKCKDKEKYLKKAFGDKFPDLDCSLDEKYVKREKAILSNNDNFANN